MTIYSAMPFRAIYRLLDIPDKVRVTITKTEPMYLLEALPVGTSDAAVDAVAEFKRHNVATIQGSDELLFEVMCWLEEEVTTGKLDDDYAVVPVPDGMTVNGKAPNFRSLEHSQIIWRYGSDDDVILLKMRWDGATQ